MSDLLLILSGNCHCTPTEYKRNAQAFQLNVLSQKQGHEQNKTTLATYSREKGSQNNKNKWHIPYDCG